MGCTTGDNSAGSAGGWAAGCCFHRVNYTMQHGVSGRQQNGKQPLPTMLTVRAHDLGAYPKPSPRTCSTSVLSSVDVGRSSATTAGGGGSPADPAAHEELFVDASGTAAIWRTLGGQVTHASFRSAVLGPGAHGLVANSSSSSGHATITQVVRCRFPALLEGWSAKQDEDSVAEVGGTRECWRQQGRLEEDQQQHRRRQQERQRGRRRRAQRGPWSVCILRQPDLVTVHYPNGDTFDVTLPCEARFLQPLEEGLLVQRFSGDAGEEFSDRTGDIRVKQGTHNSMVHDFESFASSGQVSLDFSDTETETPSLFSLLHPLDELRPVALLPPSRAKICDNDAETRENGEVQPGREDYHQRLVCDAAERVLFAGGGGAGGTGVDSSLLLTYHAGRRRHSLWLVLPVPEPSEQQRPDPQPDPEPEPEAELVSDAPPAPPQGDVSVLGPLVNETPRHEGLRTATMTSTPAAENSSLSSTLLGISALDSSSSVAALSMIDSVLTAGAGGGRLTRDRFSAGNARRISGGAGRRTSTGSNTSWIGAGTTRNEVLASALGLGQSALGVATPVLNLMAPGGTTRVGGVGGESSFPPPFSATGGFGDIVGALGQADTILDDEEEEEDYAQHIRPHLGLSLLWREGEDCQAPAQNVFCVAAGSPTAQGGRAGGALSAGTVFDREFLVCLADSQAETLRALSISVNDTAAAAPSADDNMNQVTNSKVVVAEAFTRPCRAAVGLCATTGAEKEGNPGGTIAANILLLTPDRRLILQRSVDEITEVVLSPPHGGAGSTVLEQDGGDQLESLSDAIGSCFTFETRVGHRRRARLFLEPTSPLVAACLGAWDCLLSPALAASLRADVIGVAQMLATEDVAGLDEIVNNLRTENGHVKGQVNLGDKPAVGGDLDWTALVSVLSELTLQNDSASKDTPARPPSAGRLYDGDTIGNAISSRGGGVDGGISEDSGAWAAFLSSPVQDQYTRDNVMLLSGLRAAGQPKSSDESAAKLSADRTHRPSKPSPPAEPASGWRPALHAQKTAFHAEFGAVFDALHLVLEDMKISRLTASWVPRLASLLLSLARVCGANGKGMGDFEDHYWRDAASCGNGHGEAASMVSAPGGIASGGGRLPPRPTSFEKVPCIRGWVHARIRTGMLSKTANPAFGGGNKKIEIPCYIGEEGTFPTLPRSCGALQSTRQLCRFYEILCTASATAAQGAKPAAVTDKFDEGAGLKCAGDWVGARLVAAMVDEGYGVDDLDRAQLGLTLPLLEVLHAARGQAPADWPAAAQDLVGREDLSALRRMLKTGDRYRSDSKGGAGSGDADDEGNLGLEGGFWAGGRISGSGAGESSVGETRDAGVVARVRDGGGGGNGESADFDGLALVDEASSLRFGRDRRVREACRLLRGSRPVRFHVKRSPESSDHDHQQRQQARLLQLAMRTLAGPAGRGMLTLGTLAPLLAEPLLIPSLCLAGRIRKPADVVVNLDVAAAGITVETTLWAEFHNGVAAGLRLRHDWGSSGGGGRGGARSHGGSATGGTFEGGNVSRTWITYNRPAGGANNAHGGLLMALGLQGHLSSLAMTDVYEYLTLGQESVTVGVLLGMAAARRGSADLSTQKMLCLHVPSLLPHPFAEMETSSVTQAAALAGIGLLYQGTSHRLMTEFLLGEMGKSPCSDRFADREGYALACGLSLGMINLGKGASGGMAGVADLKLEQQLHRLLVGGKDPSTAGGSDANGPNSRSGVGARAGGRRPSSGGVIGSEVTGPSRISPGEYVNTDVTAPAALAALALMHMRSGDKALAARLALPQTHFQLDYARPEQLLLRVVVRGLVMWDDVQPTDRWIEEQIPEVVSTEYRRLHKPLPEELISVVDRQTVRQAHANIVAGGCLCLGLRFAGTADERARATVLGRVIHFKRLRKNSAGGGASGAGSARNPIRSSRRPERPVLEMCLSTAVAALGMIMAGTGDLECLRIMRELRGRVESEVTYGTHMAISMGIGLLFVGGGMASLGRDREHIAALLAAFFPRYPAAPDDNQYHLQALRHLYVLAVQRRGVDAVDVDTGEKLFVPLTVKLRPQKSTKNNDQFGDSNDAESLRNPAHSSSLEHEQSSLDMTASRVPSASVATGAANGTGSHGENALALVTPCILPDLSEVARVSIRSPRYFPVELDLANDSALAAALRRECKIFVKRRVGHLSYKNDPHALRSLLFQSYPGPLASSSTITSHGSQHHNHHHHHHSRGHGHQHHDLAHLGNAGGRSDDLGQSKADFLSTFTEDPHLLNFARHFCDAGMRSRASVGVTARNGGGAVGLPSGRRLMIGGEALGEAPALARYCGGALLECLSGEKAEALAPHLSLCHSAVTARHTADASAAWDLRLVLDYGRGSPLQAALTSAAARAKAVATAAVAATDVIRDVVVSSTGGDGSEEVRTESADNHEEKDASSTSAMASVAGNDGRGFVADEDVEGTGRDEAEPPLPFALLHSDLLASLEVQLDAFFSSLRFDETRREGAAHAEGRRRRASHLWRYLSRGEVNFGDDGCRGNSRLFGAFLAYFGIPAPQALEQALGGKKIPANGLGLADAPSLIRHIPGLSPSALLKMMSQ